MNFEFATAQRIVFGRGASRKIEEYTAQFGRRVLVVQGSSVDRIRPVTDSLKQAGLSVREFAVEGEPTTHIVRRGVELALVEGSQVILGVGGGSALDAGKAIAALATNQGDVLDYLEVIGKGQLLKEAPLPYIALPTTAGTGTEVTRNAVLGSPEHAVKVSLRSEMMLPRLALVDPELTLQLPPQVTASTGMDALTQLIEPFVSISANPMTDAVCREGMQRVARSLKQAYRCGEDIAAREDMSLAALFGGLALANARLGAVHGLAGPIGGMFNAAHGAVCGYLLPEVMQTNLETLRIHGDSKNVLERFDEIARILTGNLQATAMEGVDWVRALRNEVGLAPLSTYGITPDHFPELVEKSIHSSSMKGNPVALTTAQLETILRQAM